MTMENLIGEELVNHCGITEGNVCDAQQLLEELTDQLSDRFTAADPCTIKDLHDTLMELKANVSTLANHAMKTSEGCTETHLSDYSGNGVFDEQ